MSASKVLKLMKEKEVEYVDLRFTDPRGKLQHLTMDGKMVDENMLNEVRDIPDIEDEPVMTCLGVGIYEKNNKLLSEYEYAKTL